MTEDQARDVLKRYRASPGYPKPGESFGLSIVLLKARIHDRLIARGVRQIEARFRSERIYERIMRYKPTFAHYCDAVRVVRQAEAPPSKVFTQEELEAIAERFAMSNDDLGMSIASKATRQLDR